MRCYSFRLLVSLVMLVGCVALSSAQQPAKKPLNHNCYDLWNSISGATISNDGQWVLYSIKPGKGDSTVKIVHTAKKKDYALKRASSAKITEDCRFALYLTKPKSVSGKNSKAPTKTTLNILELQTGKITKIEDVRSFSTPSRAAGWVAYLMAPDEPPAKKTDATKGKTKGKKKGAKPAPKKGGKSKKGSPPNKKIQGSDMVLRNLSTGAENRFANVVSYRFHKNGKRLVYRASADKEVDSGVFVVDVASGNAKAIHNGDGQYGTIVFDDAGERVAFMHAAKNEDEKKKDWSIYFWQAPMTEAQAVVNAKTDGIPGGWELTSSTPSFSNNGKRLFFNTRPAPKEEKTKKKPAKKSNVNVDIWHWKDPLLQPEQLLRARLTKSRSYRAVAHLDENKVVQLATKDIPIAIVANEGDGDNAVGSSFKAYRMISSWDFPTYRDVYLIDVNTGKSEKILSKVQSSASLSPQGKYLTWWDAEESAWMCMSTKSRKIVNLSKHIPHPVHNELHDQPARASAYGSAGWVKGDKAILLYDRFDVWAVDPESVLPPVCVTDGYGRAKIIRLRYTRLNVEDRFIDPDDPMILSAFDDKTKATGYFRDQVRGNKKPAKLIMRNEQLSSLQKARNADKVILTCATFQKYPDVWTGSLNFKGMKQLSHANPQQSKYLWGTAELVSWTSLDGNKLTGILYKPEGFSPKKKYPMLVYFYERLSDRLHRYTSPSTSRSSINVSFYVSRGYVVFLPDIPYRVGHPGQSCVNAVLPGVANIINRGFVDPKRIGVQGHSWGGYQIAYLVTRTKMFAAAEAGAPVSNMTSAYGGIRWSSAKSRMFQYEKTQSRIGGTLWDAQHRYIENSPVFWADRVHTPLLMLHNDKDGAVPWYQGIEMFVALRRLGKPCWMFNYNGEGHGLGKKENRRDWTIRLQQYFDHHLKGAPAPRWLSEGVPAEERGGTLGLATSKK